MSKHTSCSGTTHKISASLPQAGPNSNDLRLFHNSPFLLQLPKLRALQIRLTRTPFTHQVSLNELNRKCFCSFLSAKPPLVSSHQACCERVSLLVDGGPAQYTLLLLGNSFLVHCIWPHKKLAYKNAII